MPNRNEARTTDVAPRPADDQGSYAYFLRAISAVDGMNDEELKAYKLVIETAWRQRFRSASTLPPSPPPDTLPPEEGTLPTHGTARRSSVLPSRSSVLPKKISGQFSRIKLPEKGENTVAIVMDQVLSLEGFCIQVPGAKLDEIGYPSYTPKRRAKGSMTVQTWVDRRFSKNYPGHEVNVIFADGNPARGNVQLSTVRETYESDE